MCGCAQCPNFEVCHMWAPPWYFGCHHGRCGGCNMDFAKNLEFVSSSETCSICLEEKVRFVVHPANCGHKFCIECTRKAWWPEKPEYPEPCQFGFVTPCECCNGRGEVCDNYQQAEDEWMGGDSEAAQAYNKACDAIDEDYKKSLEDRANPQKCPICRTHIADATNNSWEIPRNR